MRSPFPLTLSLALLTACRSQNESWARAYVIEDLSQAIGGVKATAQPGDFLLENDRIRVAVLGPRNSYGPGLYGGSIVDADLQRDDPRYAHGQGNDLFAELIPTVNMNIPRAVEEGDVEIVADGSDGGAAVLRVTAPEAPYFSLMELLWAFLGIPDQVYVTDYILEPGAPYLLLRTTVSWGGEQVATDGQQLPVASEAMPLLNYALETGVVMGDFFLPGGSVDVFAPGVGFDEGLAVLEAHEAGRNMFLDPLSAEFLAATGDGTSYAYGPLDGEGIIQIPLFTSNLTFSATHGLRGDGSDDRFAEGSAFTAERVFALGQGDVGSAVDALLEARSAPVGRVEGFVLEQGTGEPISDAHVFAYQGIGEARASRPWNEWRSDVGQDTRPDGSFAGTLPPGDWTLLPHQKGRAAGQAVEIRVVEGQAQSVALGLPMAGSVQVEVVDDEGRPVPAKVSFFSASGLSTRDTILGDGYMAGEVCDVVHSLGEALSVQLPTGEYYAVASRGPEYEVHQSEPFLVSDHERIRLQLQVTRVVDSSGFVAADFHVHSATSFDSGTSQEYRLRSMAAEAVEFFPSTDHDYLTDHAPVVEALGLEPWLRVVTGVEVSPIEMGHFLGFPLAQDHLAEAGGAFEWTDMEPDQVADGLRDLSDPAVEGGALVAVAHPRDGILGLFDQYGFNPYVADGDDVEVDTPAQNRANELLLEENFTLDFELLEVLNAKRFELIRSPTQSESDRYEAGEALSAYQVISRTMEEQQALIDGDEQLAWGIKGQVDDWFTLLNLGYRHTIIGNSDTHTPTKTESGCPRNYVLSSTDDPAYIDPSELMQALREHRVVASYGPFVRFEAAGQPVGSEVAVDSELELSIQVQSPSWFDVDRVELYENGTLIHEWSIEGGQGAVDLDERYPVSPERDSWYVVVAMGDSQMHPVFVGQERPYIVLQDQIMEAVAQIELVADLMPAVRHKIDRFPIVPYAITNPIWADAGGDGWAPPGLPSWLSEPVEPGT